LTLATVKNENGAKLSTPSLLWVDTHAIGRGKIELIKIL
jgi:hypothetical protein